MCEAEFEKNEEIINKKICIHVSDADRRAFNLDGEHFSQANFKSSEYFIITFFNFDRLISSKATMKFKSCRSSWKNTL